MNIIRANEYEFVNLDFVHSIRIDKTQDGFFVATFQLPHAPITSNKYESFKEILDWIYKHDPR